MKKLILRHIRDIILITIISTGISLFFSPMHEIQWSWLKLNIIYSFIIGTSLWKGNQIVGYLIDKAIPPKASLAFNLRIQISGMIVFSIVNIFVVNYLWFGVYQGADFIKFIQRGGYSIFLVEFIVTMVIGLSFYVNGYFKSWKTSLENEEALKREKLALQYESLKNQVNPHFLFNSLNTLSSLVYTNPAKADAFIRKLSEIYRYIIEQKDVELINLNEEIEFIHKYVDLLKIRFENNLEVEFDMSQTSNYEVIPISIQMLIENAIKHNIISQEHPLKIQLVLHNNYLLVKNNYQPKQKLQQQESIRKTKIGLQNLKIRYEYLSGMEFKINDPQNKDSQNKQEFTVKIPLILSENILTK